MPPADHGLYISAGGLNNLLQESAQTIFGRIHYLLADQDPYNCAGGNAITSFNGGAVSKFVLFMKHKNTRPYHLDLNSPGGEGLTKNSKHFLQKVIQQKITPFFYHFLFFIFFSNEAIKFN